MDPDALEKQAVTTSKWDFFDDTQQSGAGKTDAKGGLNLTSYDSDDGSSAGSEDVDGKPINDDDDDDDDDVDGRPMDEEDSINGKPIEMKSEHREG